MRNPSAFCLIELVATVAASDDTDTGLINGTKYYYIVKATNAVGASANSAQVSVQPVSSESANLSFNLGDGQFEFSWPAGHTGWRLQMSTHQRQRIFIPSNLS